MPRLAAAAVASAIAAAACEAGAHRGSCERLGEHARRVGQLVERVGETDLAAVAAVREALQEGLEAALRTALELVQSCGRDKSFLYMLAVGWQLLYRFRQAHDEIDRCLRLVPLASFVHEFRMQTLKEALKAVEEDQRDYSLDEEDIEAQKVILKPDRTKKDADILEKALSRRYPDLGFDKALREEEEKLNIELHRSRMNNDFDQCRVIEHLIGLTKCVVNVHPSKRVEKLISNEPTYVVSGFITNGDFGLKSEDEAQSQWRADLFGCCTEPCLSLKTFLYPCGTFSWIANVVSKGKIAHEQGINNLLAYSVFGGCCCYTCCIRTKLRQLFDIEGSSCDDFLTHLMCCCCAMVQERRELELRNFEGCQGRKMIHPPFQYMKT